MKHAPLMKLLAGAVLAATLAGQPVISHAADKDQKAALYPNATRQEPKLDLKSEKEQKALNEGLDAVNAGDDAKASSILQPLADSSDSKYAQALALQGLASVKYKAGDVKGAAQLLQKALDNGTLPNDTYFQLLFEQAQFQTASEQYQASLDTIAKWRAEGKKETADSYALEGNDYYRLEKYQQAITAIKKAQSMTDKPKATWNQILLASYAETGQSDEAAKMAQQELASNPSDPNALNNAVSVLTSAKKYPEAIQLLEKAKASGNFKDEKQYVNLAKLYLVSSQDSDDPKPNAIKAAQTLNEGMSKGVVKATSDNYKLLGDANYVADNSSKAVEAYRKAIPGAKDGEPAVRAGQLLLSENKYSEAKTLVQQGIDKGVKHKGTAYMVLAEAERGMKNKPAAIAAMKKAAQDPETSSKANAWLKSAAKGS